MMFAMNDTIFTHYVTQYTSCALIWIEIHFLLHISSINVLISFIQ